MFRTRDFVLLFTTILFLVSGIGVTLFDQWQAGWSVEDETTSGRTGAVASSSDLVLSAALPADTSESERRQRLADLQQQIAQLDLGGTESTEVPEDDESDPASDELATTSESVVMTCVQHQPYAQFWDSRGLQVEAREGAVVVERTLETGPEVVLQLSVQTQPLAVPSCLFSDVVGIANDGSLIRNDEVGLYSIFGSETRIGYALDGFPIYGTSAVRGDACGGRIGPAGEYRYELSPDRTTVIACFSANPTALP